MRTDDDTRTLDQELASGQTETTPVLAIGAVVAVIAGLFSVFLVLASLAYVLA